jgi:hypothetical protein
MAVKFPDILEHNNPLLALVDEDFSRGGRRVVADLTALYALSGQPDQLKELVTIVHVVDQVADYILIDDTNIGNASGWALYSTFLGVTSPNLFETISVAGQSDVVADSGTDILTLIAGAGISITTNAGADSITFSSSITQYTDEMTQDAIGTISIDSDTINVTYNDGTPSLTWDVIMGSAGYSADDIVQWDGTAFVRRGIESFETWISDWRKQEWELAKSVNATYRDENKQTVTLPAQRSFPHGLIHARSKIWMVDTWSPSHIIRFNNPDDLSDYNEVIIGNSDIGVGADIIYIPETDKVYITVSDNGVTGHAYIYEIDPVTMVATQIVDVDAEWFQLQGLASDGQYLYAVSGGSTLGTAYLLKMDLSDNSYTFTSLTGTLGCHSLRYDGTNLYATSHPSNVPRLYKIDPATVTVTGTAVLTGDGCTDDFCFAGDYVYI